MGSSEQCPDVDVFAGLTDKHDEKCPCTQGECVEAAGDSPWGGESGTEWVRVRGAAVLFCFCSLVKKSSRVLYLRYDCDSLYKYACSRMMCPNRCT